jgi:hypothetical protein
MTGGMRAIASCLPLLLLLLPGCARRLPGPLECRALALASVGVDPATPATLLQRDRRLEARADELTRQCLTTPWDYPLLRCLESGGSSRACLARFEARRAQSGPLL